MLTRGQEKLIRSLQRKKGREESGRCLVEGSKVVAVAGPAVDFTFTASDTEAFDQLVTTEAPQAVAAVARIPEWSQAAVLECPTIVVLDGVQDPGNVGTIFRLCLGFEAGLLLVESADPTSPKVVRSSVGAMFQVPWRVVPRNAAEEVIGALERPIFRLEARPEAGPLTDLATTEPIVVIAGSEGNGIQLGLIGQSIAIAHDSALESLNVAAALAITLHERYRRA